MPYYTYSLLLQILWTLATSFSKKNQGDLVHIWLQWSKFMHHAIIFSFQHISLEGQMGTVVWHYSTDIWCFAPELQHAKSASDKNFNTHYSIFRLPR